MGGGSSQFRQLCHLLAAWSGIGGESGITVPRTRIGAVCPRFRPSYGELCWEPACSIKAQDKRPQSEATAGCPQSPAVRGFFTGHKPMSV